MGFELECGVDPFRPPDLPGIEVTFEALHLNRSLVLLVGRHRLLVWGTMSKREINLRLLKSAVNAVLDHLVEDLGIESVAIEDEQNSYWDCPYPEMHDVSTQPGDLTVGQLSDDFGFVKLVRRGQSADLAYNLVHIAPLLRYIGETVKS